MVDPEHTEGIIYPPLSWKSLGIPQDELENVAATATRSRQAEDNDGLNKDYHITKTIRLLRCS